jgi:hypothetical protein
VGIKQDVGGSSMMTSYILYSSHHYYYGVKIEENKMGRG